MLKRNRRLQILQTNVQKGFTLIELLVAMSVFAILVGIVTINLVNTQHHTSLASAADTFLADMHQQQMNAMIGNTQGRSTVDSYGIHFETSSYTLFHGTTYSSSDPTNSVVNLPDTIQFASVTFANSQVVFTKGSGEVLNFVSGQNTFAITDSSNGNHKTVTLNRLGIVRGIN